MSVADRPEQSRPVPANGLQAERYTVRDLEDFQAHHAQEWVRAKDYDAALAEIERLREALGCAEYALMTGARDDIEEALGLCTALGSSYTPTGEEPE